MGRIRLAIAAGLVGAVFAAYAPVFRHEFVHYDDQVYVTENPHVLAGLSASGLAWAFRTGEASNWHPLTWLSHMLDVQLYGSRAPGHLATNVALHAASVVLLFLLLASATGATGRSAAVAGLFALHPLHVESVAWVAERKDVLSTALGLVALAGWIRWARDPSPLRYATVVVAFALGLMAKPMLVSLPFLLLLVDVWPLGRRGPVTRRVTEKLPLFALAAASCAVTFLVQRAGGTVASLERLPAGERAANAAVSYARYLGKTFWPVDLAVTYPLRPWSAAAVGAALLLLAALSALAFTERRRRPWLGVGWFWFAGALVPVIGLVQVGRQSMADRYTYWPHIGLFIALVWGGSELLQRARAPRWLELGLIGAALAACGVLTFRQAGVWHDGVTLFAQAVRVAPESADAQYNLGLAYSRRGDDARAVEPLLAANRLRPQDARISFRLGNSYQRLGRLDEATQAYEATLRLDPQQATALRNLALTLQRLGRVPAAIEAYRRADQLEPLDTEARFNLAVGLMGSGQTANAELQLRRVVEQRPDWAAAQDNLGVVLANQGKLDEARSRFALAARLEPGYALARAHLAQVERQLSPAGRPPSPTP